MKQAPGAGARQLKQAQPVKVQASVRPDVPSTTAALTAMMAATALLTSQPAFADADLVLGKQVFENNCDGLGKFTLEAIVYQVENGKNAMPAWSGTLDDDEIQAVAAYVYDTASKAAW
eukprot:gene2086-2405_t